MEDGYVIDTKYLNCMEYNENPIDNSANEREEKSTITVGPGCTWGDVIRFLNPYGKSPRTMQSYCSFSVGGTLSVNGHGITSDRCLASDVISFRIARCTVCEVKEDVSSDFYNNASSAMIENTYCDLLSSKQVAFHYKTGSLAKHLNFCINGLFPFCER